jgi:hypothetical protein
VSLNLPWKAAFKSAVRARRLAGGERAAPAIPLSFANPPTDVVISDVQTTIVVRGDKWIWLAMYGDRRRFGQIYVANASRFANPA